MPSAVRVGDSTTHGGTVVGPGVATVLIGGMPAAVMSDMILCPMMYPGPAPHVGGPVMVGSATVTIGGKPAARTTDSCPCGDMAVVGDPTVTIG